MPLTNTQVSQSKPKEKDYRLTDGMGLYLLVKKSGSKYWRIDYSIHAKRKTLAVGVYPAISLKQARQARDTAKEQIAQGIDPSQQKKADADQVRTDAANTFQVVAVLWLERKAHESAKTTVDNIERCFSKDIYPYIGATPITDINAPLLIKTLQRVEKRGSLETTKRLRQWCSAVFRYGMAMGICDNDPAEVLKDVLKRPQGNHFPAVPLAEMPAYLKAIELVDTNMQTRLANQLVMHTFVRHADLREATWNEFNFEAATWTIPADRKKNKRNGDHIIPLTPHVLKVLSDLRMLNGHRELLFPQQKDPRKPMSEGCLRKLIERAGYSGKMCVHGYRTIFCTAARESGKFRNEVIECQMHHAEKNKIVDAYSRAEYLNERKELMHWFSDWLESQLSGNVVYPYFAQG